MLLPIGNGLEIEFIAYQGSVMQEKDIEVNLPLICIHPSQFSNFVIGLINEPFRYGRQPLPLKDWVIYGKMLIHQAEKAWLGAVCQLARGDNFYEADEVFNWHEPWTDSPMPGYHMRTSPNPQPYDRWFDFRVPVKELLHEVGWDLKGASVLRLGIAGDVEPGGRCIFSLKGLEIS